MDPLMNLSSFNFTADTTAPHQPFYFVQIFQTILFSLVCITGIAGNTLVIYVILRYSKMQTVTNMYIVNLAIADEFFLIGIPVLIATILHGHWVFGHWACKAYMITTSINQFTSSILLCIMSADRYIAVCHPISAQSWRTPFISKIVSCFAWCCSILLMVPIIEHAQEIVGQNGKSSCVIIWGGDADTFVTGNSTNGTNMDLPLDEPDSWPAFIFTIYTFVCSFAIPLLLILIFYWQVLRKLKTVGPKNKSREKKRSHKKVTNLVSCVVVVYIVCWTPYWVTQLAIRDNEHVTLNITLHLLASCLSYFNSAVNPILYAFLSDNFKKSFWKACTCAGNSDVNAALHLENSVFPRKSKHSSDRYRPTRNTSVCPNLEDEGETPLVKVDPSTSTTALTMTSRVNINNLGGSRDSVSLKNGNTHQQQSQPTSL
ncbi:somatostatin receptor type 2-like isoform X2 [Anthonomus grandis grandis]|nr:somatostatin receptor type 2-like isoform X2 [Anthonomus grandis grandis]XP_050310678.1 somatostatin receptor type 2-like isoform X2 [Anthonomus grandis grandis]XP_050310680.1 somatostatin receptor type 2-like isoform X2 [Anthonomus grandis grandis]XP_050310681.1 somatostatin receptor type 2-like isoform X2 [Anthonomus grandis grandis]